MVWDETDGWVFSSEFHEWIEETIPRGYRPGPGGFESSEQFARKMVYAVFTLKDDDEMHLSHVHADVFNNENPPLDSVDDIPEIFDEEGFRITGCWIHAQDSSARIDSWGPLDEASIRRELGLPLRRIKNARPASLPG